MPLFKEISKKVVSASQDAIKKTQDLSEITNKKSRKNELNKLIIKKYQNLGESYFKNLENDPTSGLDDIINELKSAFSELEIIEHDILMIQGSIKCTSCSSEFNKDMSYCPDCGQKNLNKVPEKVCTVCKAVLDDSSSFCGSCGNKID